jgi:hypothetical protein
LVVLARVRFEPFITGKELQLFDEQMFDVTGMIPRQFGQPTE